MADAKSIFSLDLKELGVFEERTKATKKTVDDIWMRSRRRADTVDRGSSGHGHAHVPTEGQQSADQENALSKAFVGFVWETSELRIDFVHVHLRCRLACPLCLKPLEQVRHQHVCESLDIK